jgi:hypothetical protein
MNLLKQSQYGESIKKIADELKYSRTTVKKYLDVLANEKKVISKEVGQYALWFHAETLQDQKDMKKSLQTYFKPIYGAILNNFDKIELNYAKIKQLGKHVSHDLPIEDMQQNPIIDTLLEHFNVSMLKTIDLNILADGIMDVIDSVLGPQDSYVWDPAIVIQESSILILRMKNSEYIDIPGHFYLMAGIIEERMQKFFPVTIDIQQIHKENKLVDFKFTIKR